MKYKIEIPPRPEKVITLTITEGELSLLRYAMYETYATSDERRAL